jgi:cysteine desulfurase/selenocysteine lyase
MRDELAKMSSITLYGPEEQIKRTSIVSFSIDGQDPQRVLEHLEAKKIILAVREIMNKKILRASPHFFNTKEEILKVVEEIRKL